MAIFQRGGFPVRALKFGMRFVFAFAFVVPSLAFAADTKPAAPPAPAQQIDKLFATLGGDISDDDARVIEAKIETLFNQSGSATVDLLMTRADAAVEAGDTKTASKLFESVTDLAPDYAEGWHNRAALQTAAGDDEGAMISLQKTLTLNPREFAAYMQLAQMLEDYGDKKGALDAYRKAQSLDPHIEDIARHVRELSRDVEGQGI
ncbi:MAG TPA: tetratricopeptide repeat protein [Rhizomicrobium sp.]|jgi:Flp pilus assembly protein TadD|nr:tetratricopeptide repeat protein [Rhizomicrobium sp.]